MIAAMTAMSLAAATAAGAATLPVSYTVDATTLKTGTPAGTLLTVSLHEDALCATPAIATEAIAIEDFDVAESIKQFKAKGATEKPPKTVRLHTVLAGVSPSSGADLFLSITGTGITAVGGSCQAQAAAGPPGAPGEAGATGPTGPTGPSGTASCYQDTGLCPSAAACSATCNSPSDVVVGGGCDCGLANMQAGLPTPTGFDCECSAVATLVAARAICCP